MAAPLLHDGDGHDDGGHLDWRISALLDGELGGAEEVLAREHLQVCDLCQQEFAEVTAARAVVRGLGEVEPPEGSMDRVVRRLRRRERAPRRLGVVGLVTVAVAWILMLVIGAGVLLPTVDAPIAGDVADHVSVSTGTWSGEEEVDGELSAPFIAPEALPGGFEEVATYRHPDGIQVVYEGQGGASLSVFEREGTLDWSSLPSGGERTEIAGRPAWLTTFEGPNGSEASVVVVPRGSLVYTVIGEAGAELESLVAELPDGRSYSYGERVRHNVDEFLRRLGID